MIRADQKKKLFLCGCPRSGTTAFTHVFTAHRKVVLGMERFNHLCTENNFQLTRNHFKLDRFLDVRAEDTFYDDFNVMHDFDTQIEEKYPECDYIGFKQPNLYFVYKQIFECFPTATIFFIYRDPVDVAASFQVRANNKTLWPADRDYKAAIDEWNISAKLTLKAAQDYPQLHIVSYDGIFNSEQNLSPLFNLLNLEMTQLVYDRIAYLRDNNKTICTKRQSVLSSYQISEVNNNIASSLFEALEKKRLL